MAMMMIQTFGVFQKTFCIIDVSRAPQETCLSNKDKGSMGFRLQATNLTSLLNFSFTKDEFSKNVSLCQESLRYGCAT